MQNPAHGIPRTVGHRARRRLARGLVAVLATLGVALTVAAVPTAPAAAETAVPAGSPATVSADALPTWQVNGVVWSQVVVGTTVYATGSFTRARPPGVAAGGTGEVPAAYVFAYDITTGNRVASFDHALNGQGLTITRSPDGSRVYVGGDFTTVDGQARGHLAAFDTATNALVPGFAPSVSNQVAAVTASNDTVWFGGSFFNVNGQGRTRLAAVAAGTGANRTWAPKADDNNVSAMVLAPSGDRVVVGGRFSTLNGQPANGMGSVDATSGATLGWAANQTIRNAGTGSGITSLSTDGTQVYGTGFAYQSGNFEGAFAADPATGNLAWANDCHGDTYDAEPVGGVLYTVSHAHDCSWIGSFFQSDPWETNMRHALAFTTKATGVNTGPDNYGWNYGGVPASGLLQWYPDVAIGSSTGQNQAAWSVTSGGDYVALGGEFPRVNGVAQQGLVRFAAKDKAPNKRGPVRPPNPTAPQAVSNAGGEVRVSWQSAYDMDDNRLTYTVYRSGTTTPVFTTTAPSTYWDYPNLGFRDTGLSPGSSYTYRVVVSDPAGNTLTLPTTAAVTVRAGSPSAYSKDVTGDGARAYWRLGEPSGSTVYDYAGFNDATASAGVTRGTAGAIAGDPDQASTFSGGDDGLVVSPRMTTTPAFSIETWIRTTTTSGGKIVGYGNAASGASSGYDRHLYMTNDGRLVFGVYPGSVQTATSPGSYNDGAWHHVVATQGSSGLALYVDGRKVGSNGSAVSAQDYSGYWRIGGDNLDGWPDQPTSRSFAGSIDDVAIYPSALSATQVRQHLTDAGGSVGGPVAPTDTYGRAVLASSPDLYWRLGESGGTALDYSGNGADGSYAGGVTGGQAGAVSGTSDPATRFDGRDGTVGSLTRSAAPTVYSEEAWFKTQTTHGGKLIGFGDQRSGYSGNYDRHVYMENSGQLTFGTWTGQTNLATSPQAYNDGAWHHVVATQGPDGMRLYVDGQLVADNPQTQAQVYDGYWRVGGDSDWGGDSAFLDGTIDEVAVYSRVLSADAVLAHFKAGGGTAPHQPPTAAFTATAAGLRASFDGSGSTADGGVASYAWDFGDGSSGSGARPDHTYAHAGSYDARLTVTDGTGATASATHTVTVTNTAPTASFTAGTSNLTVSVDGSGSADPDGTVTGYAWTWGDGTAAGSGATTTHTYAAAGTYTVRLTVTDSDGATTSTTRDVTVTAPAPTTLAGDTFTRTVTGGWGRADSGGAWTIKGNAANFSVAGGQGTINLAAAGSGPQAFLDGVTATGTDTSVTFSPRKAATGGGTNLYVVGREVSAGGGYRAYVNLRANGTVALGILRRTAAGGETFVVNPVVVSGLTANAGDRYTVRFLVSGTSPTTLKARIWKAGTTEPTTWTVSGTDATGDFQAAGRVGLMAYLSGTATNAPVAIDVDDLVVRPVG